MTGDMTVAGPLPLLLVVVVVVVGVVEVLGTAVGGDCTPPPDGVEGEMPPMRLPPGRTAALPTGTGGGGGAPPFILNTAARFSTSLEIALPRAEIEPDGGGVVCAVAAAAEEKV